jgi:hypothetical protein
MERTDAASTAFELAVSLKAASMRLDELDRSTADLRVSAAITAAALEGLVHRAERLRTQLSSAAAVVAQTQAPSSPRVRRYARPHRRSSADEVAEDHRLLEERGVDPSEVRLEDLLPADCVRRLERRLIADDRVRVQLDLYDGLAVIAAGVTATVIDTLLVRTPKDSPLTPALRRRAMASDNWLAGHARVSFDHVHSHSIPGLGPSSHRVQTFGHDLLFALVVGVRDVMAGTMTATGDHGGLYRVPTAAPVANPLVALATVIAHLMSDVVTRSGLPLPGWVGVASAPMEFGPGGRPIGAVARGMYINGYDTWHLPAMATNTASVEAILRAYWAVRSTHDRDWAEAVEYEAQFVGAEKVGDHPRYRSLALMAHGLAAGGNLTKTLALKDPLALNYTQWLALGHAAARWAASRNHPPGRVSAARVRLNMRTIDAGWEELAG